uniref:DEAD domain-containing protein n=1 Tax=Ascaris lumbricoides TaxID=6252 RepID=A0A0M3ID99_ASCLU
MENFPAWVCEEIIAEYHKKGLTSLFHWQAELLSDDRLRSPQYMNLLFSAPTSAGKTIVAELIALNTILTRKRKALFIFPYISVAREKFLNLQVSWLNYTVIVFILLFIFLFLLNFKW